MSDQHGERPHRPATQHDAADFAARTFTSELPLVQRPQAELNLDLEVVDDPLEDRDATRAHIAQLRAAGLL